MNLHKFLKWTNERLSRSKGINFEMWKNLFEILFMPILVLLLLNLHCRNDVLAHCYNNGSKWFITQSSNIKSKTKLVQSTILWASFWWGHSQGHKMMFQFKIGLPGPALWIFCYQVLVILIRSIELASK